MRPRIRRTTWPTPALVLTDTPRPNCPYCQGEGGHQVDFADPETGEYIDSDWDPCDCWDEDRSWTLLPLPRIPRRRQPYVDPWGTGYNDEPPF